MLLPFQYHKNIYLSLALENNLCNMTTYGFQRDDTFIKILSYTFKVNYTSIITVQHNLDNINNFFSKFIRKPKIQFYPGILRDHPNIN